MIADAVETMNRILVRETHSLLQYLTDAWPWTGSAAGPTLEALQKLTAEEQAGAQRITDYLLKRRASPAVGRFPDAFTTFHFLGLDHLLPRLIAYQRGTVAELEKDFAQVREEEAWNIVRELLETKRRHLADLERLASEYGGKQTASTVR